VRVWAGKSASLAELVKIEARFIHGLSPTCPPKTLTYTLDAGFPSGASINATNGVFTWTPTEAQGPGSYPVTVRVSDNFSLPGTAAETTYHQGQRK